ncbi:hypothetical protein CQ010_05565 [Arthrobacter sp. MYb211]|uniref:hypothetical protein n=1 Tax=Micrococcaceae TaxID=1268 RepID=UPI000BB6B310|nr:MULTISPECIES: hypothetical protein [Micrococcaceae]PCC28251.1 hypothetical protein CIK76_12545 [Glutamicibacter sp. BW80]PRA13995.1 hypothetical protein CQ015_01555 [Arthrobacter sp. MYb221]PRC09365.1 hypothetical protein CQ010_05565 [Arthrobacter sp. MYb211]
MSNSTEIHEALGTFDKTTSRWGRITMIIGLFFSLAAPTYLVFFSGLDIELAGVLAAFAALAAVFGVIWVVEPLTYYPILGASSMYQAFMIGNISNKLLPAAMIAQSTIGVRPGTRKGELSSVAAICGAAAVHLTSLFIFVGLLGTWLVSVIPADIVNTVQVYILPTVMGAVLIQAIVSQKSPRAAVIALVVSLIVVFVLSPLSPKMALFSTAIAVISTAVLAWVLRDRKSLPSTEDSEGEVPPEGPVY